MGINVQQNVPVLFQCLVRVVAIAWVVSTSFRTSLNIALEPALVLQRARKGPADGRLGAVAQHQQKLAVFAA